MRISIFVFLILSAVLLAGFYGALFDQITYTVSNEFFTKMRFHQHGVKGNVNERWEVAKIGFENTWKVGLILGTFLSLGGLLQSSNRKMLAVTMQSIVISMVTGFLFGIIALLFAHPSIEIASEMNIENKDAFNKVLSMNNYSYVGGIIGMFLGLGWQVLHTRLHRKN